MTPFYGLVIVSVFVALMFFLSIIFWAFFVLFYFDLTGRIEHLRGEIKGLKAVIGGGTEENRKKIESEEKSLRSFEAEKRVKGLWLLLWSLLILLSFVAALAVHAVWQLMA